MNNDGSMQTDKATVDLSFARSAARLSFTSNTFTNNINSYFILRIDTTTTAAQVSVSKNIFTSNVVTSNFLSVFGLGGYGISVNNNSFNNPQSLYDLDTYNVVLPTQTTYSINAVGNYWGLSTADSWTIRSRIVDFFRNPNLIPVQFHPFCVDPSCATLSANATSNTFINNGTGK